MKYLTFFITILISLQILAVQPVLATSVTTQGGNGVVANSPIVPSLQNPLKASNVKDFLFSLVDAAITIGVILAVLTFIFIGFKFVLAQGNEKALADAKMWFMYAAIGTAILISSKVIVEVIKATLISAGVVNENLF